MTEIELVAKIEEGDLQAFQQLYEEFYVSLCVYARRFTRANEIAEEVVQDVFLTLWEQQGRLTITTSLKAYLFTSVRNRCLDHLKHLQVVNRYNEYYSNLLRDAEDLYIFSQESGDAWLIAGELEKKLTDAVGLLPEQCRRIFMLSRYDGYKNQDIADNLGVTVNTVQRQISIALEKLRVSMKKYLSLLLFYSCFF